MSKKLTQDADERIADICRVLGWTEADYFDFQLDIGALYLEIYLKGDGFCVDQIKHCRVFWNWWRNHWANRNQEFFIYTQEAGLSRKELITFYRLQNDPHELAKAIWPNGVVLQETYAFMMGEIIDQSVTHEHEDNF